MSTEKKLDETENFYNKRCYSSLFQMIVNDCVTWVWLATFRPPYCKEILLLTEVAHEGVALTWDKLHVDPITTHKRASLILPAVCHRYLIDNII